MKKFISAFLIFLSLHAAAQTKNDIIGQWTITKVISLSLASPEELQQIDGFLSNNWHMDFKENGTMVATPSNPGEINTWEFDEKTKTITLSMKEKSMPVEILEFQPKNMRIRMALEGRLAEFGLQKK